MPASSTITTPSVSLSEHSRRHSQVVPLHAWRNGSNSTAITLKIRWSATLSIATKILILLSNITQAAAETHLLLHAGAQHLHFGQHANVHFGAGALHCQPLQPLHGQLHAILLHSSIKHTWGLCLRLHRPMHTPTPTFAGTYEIHVQSLTCDNALFKRKHGHTYVGNIRKIVPQ